MTDGAYIYVYRVPLSRARVQDFSIEGRARVRSTEDTRVSDNPISEWLVVVSLRRLPGDAETSTRINLH